MIHYYFIWFGDILIGYALIGMLAWFFRDLEPRALVRWGIALVLVQLLVMGGVGRLCAFAERRDRRRQRRAPRRSKQWAELSREIAVPSAASPARGRWRCISAPGRASPSIS